MYQSFIAALCSPQGKLLFFQGFHSKANIFFVKSKYIIKICDDFKNIFFLAILDLRNSNPLKLA